MDIMTASKLLMKVTKLTTKRAIPNKVTNHAAPITWSSRKIERVGNSSLDAETFGVTKSPCTLSRRSTNRCTEQRWEILFVSVVDSKDLYMAVNNINHIQDD